MVAALKRFFLKVIRSWGQLSIKCLAVKPCHHYIGEHLPFCFLSSEQTWRVRSSAQSKIPEWLSDLAKATQ